MKRTQIYGLPGQYMLLTMDLRAGAFELVTYLDGKRIKFLDIKNGQQTFIMPQGDVFAEQSEGSEGLFNVVPVRSGGIVKGASAYEIAVRNGFVGTEQEWLASLVGKQGIPGMDGANGSDGAGLKVGNAIITFNYGDFVNVPKGFLIPNGALVSRAEFSQLFAVYGERFHRGDGSTTFGLPNMVGGVGRFPRMFANKEDIGQQQHAGMPNITGCVGAGGENYGFHVLRASGAFRIGDGYNGNIGAGGNTTYHDIFMEASRSSSLYGAVTNEVRPHSIVAGFLIYAGES